MTGRNVVDFGQRFIAAVKQSDTWDEVSAWEDANHDKLLKLASDPKASMVKQAIHTALENAQQRFGMADLINEADVEDVLREPQ